VEKTPHSEKPDIYKIYAIKYAQHERLAIANFMDPPDIHDGEMPINFYVWLLRSKDKTILVDTGFNAKTASKRGRKLIRCPTEGIKLLGVDASSIKDIIITHLHYDHVGNFDLFPNASFHLQETEMAFATGRNMRYKPFRAPMEIDHVVGMVRKVFSEKVIFHDGYAQLTPGIELHHIGGHTAGLQCVRVMTKRGWVVLASDASHLYANMEKNNPYPIIFQEDKMLKGFETLISLAATKSHIIPGHDPLVMKRYPPPHKDLQGVIASLDENELDHE